MIQAVLAEANEKMEKAVEAAKDDFGTIRTGRANPAMFQKIIVDYYGTGTPLGNLASIQVLEARSLAITPYDKGALMNIEKAIRDVPNLGAQPNNDGTVIRVTLPDLTEERRKELVKRAKSEGEHAKVSIRSARRDVNEECKKLQKDGLPEDMIKDAEAKVQQMTDKMIIKVDEVLATKEKEIMTV